MRLRSWLDHGLGEEGALLMDDDAFADRDVDEISDKAASDDPVMAHFIAHHSFELMERRGRR